jgi:hypothetical protein
MAVAKLAPNRRAVVAVALSGSVAVLAAAVAPSSGVAAQPTHDDEAAPAVAGSGAWSYFSDPRALRHRGVDRVAWLNQRRIEVWSRARRVQTIAHVPRVDDHAAPALAQMPNGNLAVFWSPHTSRGRDGLYYRIAEGGRHWGPTRRVPTNSLGRFGWTYAHPLSVGRTLTAFWRGGNWQPTYSRTRNGIAWSRARTLLLGPMHTPRTRHRPYAKYSSDGRSVHIAYTEAHPGRLRTSVSYLRLRNGRVYNAAGRRLGRPPVRWSRGTRVYSGRRGSAFVLDVAAVKGKVTIVYTRKHRAGNEYRYATYARGVWRDRRILRSPRLRGNRGSYPGGAALSPTNPRVVYLSHRDGAHFEISAVATLDRGRTWARRRLTSRSEVDNIRPSPVVGGRAVVWMAGTYTHYRRFSTRVLLTAARRASKVTGPEAQ